MKKEAFIILLTILASIPALAIGFYTQLNPTLNNAMLLLGCGIEYLAIAITFFIDILTDWNKKEGLNETNSIR